MAQVPPDDTRAALPAELGGGSVAGAARRAGSFQGSAAFFTEDRVDAILDLALGAFH